jgi:hypothetical protein
VLGLFAKLYSRALGLTAMPNPRVIFIILIIILNFHDPSLSGSTTTPDPRALDVSLAARLCHKNAITK